MLVKRWRCLLLIITTAFIITYTSPVLAAFQLPVFNWDNSNYSIDTITIADRSLVSTKQKPASNIFQQLNLTREQQEQIKKIHHRYKQQIHKKRNSLAILQKQLSDLMVGTEPATLIRAKNQQLVSLRQEIGELKFESMLATREILTPQQRQKFREIIESQLAP